MRSTNECIRSKDIFIQNISLLSKYFLPRYILSKKYFLSEYILPKKYPSKLFQKNIFPNSFKKISFLSEYFFSFQKNIFPFFSFQKNIFPFFHFKKISFQTLSKKYLSKLFQKNIISKKYFSKLFQKNIISKKYFSKLFQKNIFPFKKNIFPNSFKKISFQKKYFLS